ncbi:Two-component response regulator ARR18 [Acorus gramineus]|uniref:Two-component response regulator ARR18 n=1 Tax=Acorus gramineus TaxID=55184 RepID=A0AAV9A6B6_ACOGR|nr:Two-component response regulator ARR18 [Acorus gramineus]
MGSPSDLTLESKPGVYPVLQKLAAPSEPTEKLEEFLARLEEERLKIDAFKRELPLCMQLLNNALEVSRQQLQTYNTPVAAPPEPVLEEFIPLKRPVPELLDEKASWMTSAQLWSQTNDPKRQVKPELPPDEAEAAPPKLGGAFHPFSKVDRSANAAPISQALTELALSTSEKECVREKKCAVAAEEGKGGGGGGGGGGEQAQRKARRCWSPDLHRRFVNALQMLGGSQVATPKQIRELMKVDGLTNDEVKSHLQKYRLHTRRPSPSPQAQTTSGPQLVVLGGIWVPHDYATAAAGPAIYGPHYTVPGPHSPQAAHYTAQEFYPALPPPPPLPAHQAHYPRPKHHRRNSMSTESDGGCRSESIEEEGKSESSEKGEEDSEGTDVALKF